MLCCMEKGQQWQFAHDDTRVLSTPTPTQGHALATKMSKCFDHESCFGLRGACHDEPSSACSAHRRCIPRRCNASDALPRLPFVLRRCAGGWLGAGGRELELRPFGGLKQLCAGAQRDDLQQRKRECVGGVI